MNTKIILPPLAFNFEVNDAGHFTRLVRHFLTEVVVLEAERLLLPLPVRAYHNLRGAVVRFFGVS